jgi:ATP-dependent RNA helicase SUPV3L1/SUV3
MRSPVTALLGPTNTGKTFIAIERMLAHRTGMIGFPLRLLARENYERVVAARGAHCVALVTGEERVVPKAPTYFVCTVEAMPVDRRVHFLAVDEIQLAADRERGHVFTDRLLHARGLEETWFVGAETIRPLIQKLVPEAGILSRPRLSTLSYGPPRRLARLPRRSAVIVFSMTELYAVAEALRREVGGVALVFGALSPRTRNAQVALYQAGEVDYLVATDAIGMGLNLDIDHVTFTSLTKFDGVGPRPLRPDEIAQIAGRAGRHVKDGSFGCTDRLGELDPRLVEMLEAHRFPALPTIFWRNPDLRFVSARALLESLETMPPRPELVRTRPSDDHRAFGLLARDAALAARLTNEAAVRALWEVCQVPDFRAVMSEGHTRLLAELFAHLRGPRGRLPEEWVEAHVRRLDGAEGDVEMLLSRIAGIRTWTFIAHRPGWLADPAHWQERTRAVEDRLSDALHERLTAQFVDRRAAIIARHEPGALLTQVADDGEVLVQGLRAGRLEGFRFRPETGLRVEARGLLAAANRGLRAGIADQVLACEGDSDHAFSLSPEGRLLWRSEAVGLLAAGDSTLAPLVLVLPSDLLSPPLRSRVRKRLARFVEAQLRQRLAPLMALREAELSGAARGLVFSLAEGLGSTPRRVAASQVASLSRGDRRGLGALGLTFGRLSLFLRPLLGPEAVRLRVVLAAARHGLPRGPLPDGAASLSDGPATEAETAFYMACGYQRAGPRLVRMDVLDRFSVEVEQRIRAALFPADARAAARLGCSTDEVAGVLRALGYVEREKGRFGSRRGGPSRRQQGRRA